MTETMLTRMARAIGEVPATMTEDVRHVLSEAAIERVTKAALEAIRVPDPKIVSEGYHHFSDPCWPEDAALGFTAMIDAILQGEA